MTQVTFHAQQVISRVIQYLDIDPQQEGLGYDLSPVALEDQDATDPNNWVGVQYVYQTSQEPPTRLQVMFGNPALGLMSESGELGKSRIPCRKGELRTNWISQFDTHPDPLVKAQILELIALLENDHYVSYAIPWEKEFELLDKETRDSLAGTPGFFFPILHFHHPILNYDVVVRCEPVVQLTKQSQLNNPHHN